MAFFLVSPLFPFSLHVLLFLPGHQVTGSSYAYASASRTRIKIPFISLRTSWELHLSAQVTSRCPVAGSSIHLTVTPEQVLDLDPREAEVSLVVDVAAGSCY